MLIKSFFLCICLVLVLADNSLLKSFKICKRSQSNFNNCLKNAIHDALQLLKFGLPKFGIPPIQPLETDEWTVKGSELAPFDQNYKKIRVYNQESFVIDQLEATVTENSLFIKMNGFNPMIKMVARYNYENAHTLGMDLSGNGTMVLIHFDNQFLMNISGSVVRDGNKRKLSISLVEFDLDIGRFDISYEHQHLELSKEHSRHANQNALLLYKQLQAGYSEMYAHIYKRLANLIFSKFDFDEVFPY